ncbi:ATP-binding cassette domain-containing protein [Verticiella sediminum]|nr:ATP-binding cassette domain-containing protein [Verticiella sediminum]
MSDPVRPDTACGRDSAAPIVRVEGLSKVFGDAEDRVRRRMRRGQSFAEAVANEGLAAPLDAVDLTVERGEIHVIMGLSGSGKSTLVRCINGLIAPTDGRVMVAGACVSSATPAALRELRQRHMSMVFQSFALLPHLSVTANVEFGLMLRGDETKQRRRRAAEVLDMVGLADWGERRVDELSGGMKQRIGLARALATDPDILIMDEPFSALDPLIRRSLQDELLRLQKELQKTIVFVTHDFGEALRIGSRILIMKAGRPVQTGTAAELFCDPCDEYVRAFTAHADFMHVITAGTLCRVIPEAADPPAADGARQAPRVDEDATLAQVLCAAHGADRIAVRRDGAPPRVLGTSHVLRHIGALYAERQES